MLDEHNSLDAVFGGGVIQLKPGSAADAQAHEPFFLELGIAWQYYLAAPDASWKPYVTAGASLLWMSWEYRSPVDSKNYGFITRDYLEGADGHAGLGLRAAFAGTTWIFLARLMPAASDFCPPPTPANTTTCSPTSATWDSGEDSA